MAGARSEQEVLLEVTQLSRGGMSRRAIARALGVSRNTVRKLLARHQVQRSTPNLALKAPPKQAPRPSKLDGYREAVEHLLTRFPDITAQRVFEELQRQGFEGGYTAVKQYVRKRRPKRPPVLSLPTEKYGPGKMAECDWSTYTLDFTHAGRRTVQAFAYTLTHSRRKFFRFFARTDLHPLMEGHVHAFTAFGGAAQQCKYDNQKPVVLRWEGRQPIYNPRFIDFATHYDFRPVACRPLHPNDKPRVERSLWELERSFLNGREFRDEEDLAAQLLSWQAQVCDVRRHKKTRRSALELFPEDFAALRPLPAHPYDTARVIYRVCDAEGFISWDGNRYSVPYLYVTDLLPARVTSSELFVYAADLSCIARHELRRAGASEDIVAQAHRPASFRHGADLEQLRPVYEQLGEQASLFLTSLEAALPRSAAYQARLILGLRSRYLSEDLEKALAHARRFGAFEHQAVARILAAKATPRRLEEYVAEATARKLDEVIGASMTEPRDLAEYDTLPSWCEQRLGKGFPAVPPGAQPCRRSEPNERRPDTPPPSEQTWTPSGSTSGST
jgi:transposase